MKYRVQFNAIFNNADSNNVLNHIETIKQKTFEPSVFTEVEIIRSSKKRDPVSGDIISEVKHDDIDFRNINAISHTGNPAGKTEFEIDVDVSFDIQQDYFDMLNYLETIKDKAIVGVDKIRYARHFECMHEEIPLTRDGAYSYIDFEGQILTYPLI